MKKTIFLLLFLTMCTCTFAQWFSVGAKIGYSTTLETTQAYPNMFNVSNKLQNGFHLGGYVRLGRMVYAQPEILYNYQEYTSIIEPIRGDVSETKHKISTFDIPILAGASIINSNFFKLRFMVGPKFSFNTASTPAEDVNIGNMKFHEEARTARIGLDCGIGIDIWRINIDLRYNLLPNMYRLQDADGNVLNPQALNSFQVSAGFRIFGGNNSKRSK